MGPALNSSMTRLDASLQGGPGKREDSTLPVASHPDSVGLAGLPAQGAQESTMHQEGHGN